MCEVAFLHPDLGIGGAERLILDAVKAVKLKHPKTTIWTCHFDPNHCFSDAKDHKIEVRGSKIPRHIFGFAHIFFALLSNLWLTICCALSSKAEIFIVDQVSAFIPLLRLLCPKAKILFYCHFPDLLLANHNSFLRKLYRLPFDWIEKIGLKCSHLILVNSNFTKNIVKETFGITNVNVLYPCVDCSRKVSRKRLETPFFISLNRYERKKDHNLAIKALKVVLDSNHSNEMSQIKLLIAGGYDERVIENVEHYSELENLIKELNIENHVELVKNISDDEKWIKIGEATALLYTPQREHFGIVPIEAEAVGVPVIACNSGGPIETCAQKPCKLCDPTPEAFAQAMIQLFEDKQDYTDLLKKNVSDKFGFDKFADDLNNDIEILSQKCKTD